MFNVAVIVFREFLEIALVLGVLLAATYGLPGRTRWIGLGAAAGVTGAGLVALFTEAIADFAEGMGQEVFNAGVLLLAAIMIGWTVIWMRRHGKEMSNHLKDVGHRVVEGELPMLSLSIVVALAILREGSEIVLFSYGQLAAGVTIPAMVYGAAFGAIAGTVVGVLLYLGLLKIATRHLFSVTSILLALLAAGMAAQAGGFLVQAGMIGDLAPELWDSSRLLPQNSAIGQLLHVLVGYIDRPSGIQLLFYAITIAVIAFSLKFSKRPAVSVKSAR